jgi:hypothetical protein
VKQEEAKSAERKKQREEKGRESERERGGEGRREERRGDMCLSGPCVAALKRP